MTTPHVEYSIVTPVHGRYLLRVPETSDQAPVRHAPMVVGFHGYGESAETQLARLDAVPGFEAWTLVSIQGLHAFYGRHGDVVASWMTSHQREHAIEDNLRYVRSVLVEAIHAAGEPRALMYVGYSQGAAMAWRAAILGTRRIDGLVVCGGDVPPDVSVHPLAQCPPVLLCRGRDDRIYGQTQFEADLELLARRFVAVEPCEVAGDHRWSEAIGVEIGRFASRLCHPPIPVPR
jgi:predicted esterase